MVYLLFQTVLSPAGADLGAPPHLNARVYGNYSECGYIVEDNIAAIHDSWQNIRDYDVEGVMKLVLTTIITKIGRHLQ